MRGADCYPPPQEEWEVNGRSDSCRRRRRFIGGHLVADLLRDGLQVRAIDVKPPDEPLVRLPWPRDDR